VDQVGLAFSFWLVWMGVGSAPSRQEAQTPVPKELQPYVNARSVVNQPQAELVKQYPELKDVQFAQSQEELPLLLERVGEGVDAFFRDFVNTASTESINQEMEIPQAVRRPLTSVRQETWVRQTSHPSFHHRCNYLIVAQRDKNGIALEEYRTNGKGERIELTSSYLLTSGFAATPLFFHPRYQTGSLFRYLGREVKGHRLQILAFAQRPENPELVGHLHLTAWPALLLNQGMAWVEPDTYQIVRIRTDILAPRPDMLLERLTSEIELAEVLFDRAPRPLWLPHKVTVTVEWQHTIYRTSHSYSDYKLFSVETREDKKEIVSPRRQIPQ
jgi:hypothetical protein